MRLHELLDHRDDQIGHIFLREMPLHDSTVGNGAANEVAIDISPDWLTMETDKGLHGVLASFVHVVVRQPLPREMPRLVGLGAAKRLILFDHSANSLVRLPDGFQARPDLVADPAQLLNVKTVDLRCVAA